MDNIAASHNSNIAYALKIRHSVPTTSWVGECKSSIYRISGAFPHGGKTLPNRYIIVKTYPLPTLTARAYSHDIVAYFYDVGKGTRDRQGLQDGVEVEFAIPRLGHPVRVQLITHDQYLEKNGVTPLQPWKYI